MSKSRAIASRLARPTRALGRWAVRFFAIVGVVMLTYHLAFDTTRIVSGSMSPTLQGDEFQGDWVLSEKVSYWFRAPRRWDVVRFETREGIQVAKRVAASPGETIALKEGDLVINGSRFAPPAGLAFLHYYAFGSLGGGRAHRCEQGYFVLGDYSKDSQDSRFDGELTSDRIRSRAWLVVWPWHRIGFVTP